MGKKRGPAHRPGHANGSGKQHGPPTKKQKHAPPAFTSSSSKKKGPIGSGTMTATSNSKTSSKPNKNPTQPQHLEPTIPFAPEERILLVGEGDLSFAASLVEHHGCLHVTATVLEKSVAELAEKYPHVGENVAKIEAVEGCRILFGVDARKMGPFGRKKKRKQEDGKQESGEVVTSQKTGPRVKDTKRAGSGEEEGLDDEEAGLSDNDDDDDDDDQASDDEEQTNPRRHSSAGHSNGTENSSGLMDRILFNFPHVGGKSTDVNRQVRYSQELLVDFFRRALLSLAPGGSIIVTLFEAEPYTLWNIRDLGRHVGLQVERSFRFQASAYPRYEHARTLGVVRNKQGDVGGGWKGNERSARSYVFVRKDDVPKPVPRKRPRAEDDDDEDSSDDD